MPRLAISPNISFLKSDERVVGSRVIDREAFLAIMVPFVTDSVLIATQHEDDDHYVAITLPSSVLPFVSSGVGRRSKNEEHYVVRKNFGRVDLYLKREFALQPEEVFVNVLAVEHYLSECKELEETPLSEGELRDVTHVVVGVRVYAGPQRVWIMHPRQLVSSLAKLVGQTSHEEVTRLLNSAWNVNTYWSSFAEVSD